MKTPYIVVGVLFGAVLGILVGGRELGLCAVTWVLTIPSGAAFGYFLDYVLEGLSRRRRSRPGTLELARGQPIQASDSFMGSDRLRFGETGEQGYPVTLFLDDPETRPSLTDIRIV